MSYSSHDAAVAQKVCSALEPAGYRCWIAPRDVVPGTLYADGIVGAIDESRILVLILSKDAVASAHVGKELERATSKRHPIIALRLDTAPLTRAFEYFLNESQWIEGGGSDAAIAQLVGAVGQHLSPGTATSPTNANQVSAVIRKAAAARRRWVIAAVVVAVVLAGGYFLRNAWRSKHETTASTAIVSDKSIAVLPFADMSEKKDQEYFADGMAEEIIDLLAKIPGLKVIGRTSSFQFKGKTEDLRSIGSQLGVAYVLEGSVRKSGDHLRVTAQLIDSNSGTHLFSQTYDRELIDVLKMQDEIAASLVRALQIEVSPEGIVSRPTLGNTEAYTLYLQGLHALDRTDQQGFELALGDFQHAIELDPSFAAALDGSATAYFLLAQYGFMPAPIAFEKSRAAAERSLILNPKHAQPHVQLCNIHRVYDWDWTGADQELQQARTLAPNDSNVLFASASLSLNLGRWDEGLKLINASHAQDPLSPPGYLVLNIIQLARNQPVQAEAAIRRALDISPTFSSGHYLLGTVLLARGQTDAALAEFSKESVDAVRLGGLAMAYFSLGRKSNSDAALAQLLEIQSSRPFTIARVYAFRGEPDEAFKWLDRAYAQRDPVLQILKSQLMFKKLETDPRYKAFLRKMNLPE